MFFMTFEFLSEYKILQFFAEPKFAITLYVRKVEVTLAW